MRRLFVILLIFATLTGWAKDNIIISKKEDLKIFAELISKGEKSPTILVFWLAIHWELSLASSFLPVPTFC